MKRMMTRLMLLAIAGVLAAGCEEPVDTAAQIAGGFGSWRGYRYPSRNSIGTWPTPERPNYVAIDTVPLPE